MNLAKIVVGVEYIVDLDDKSQVETAKNYIFDNLSGISDKKVCEIKPAPEGATKNDIPKFLSEPEIW